MRRSTVTFGLTHNKLIMKKKMHVFYVLLLVFRISCTASDSAMATNYPASFVQGLIDRSQATTNYSLLIQAGDSLDKIQADHEIIIKLRMALIQNCKDAIKSEKARMSGRIPVLQVVPPPPFIAAVDPSEIEDPKLRKKYEDEIAENNRLKAIGARITQLRNVLDVQEARLKMDLARSPR